MDPQTLQLITDACRQAHRLPLWVHVFNWSSLGLVVALLLWNRFLRTDRR